MSPDPLLNMRGQPLGLERPMDAWTGWNHEIKAIIDSTFNSSNDADHYLTYIGSRLVAWTDKLNDSIPRSCHITSQVIVLFFR